MTHKKIFSQKWLAKATFSRELSDVAYILAQVVAFESQLSQTERVLCLTVFFCMRWVVISQLKTRDIIGQSFVVMILCIATESVILVLKSKQRLLLSSLS